MAVGVVYGKVCEEKSCRDIKYVLSIVPEAQEHDIDFEHLTSDGRICMYVYTII